LKEGEEEGRGEGREGGGGEGGEEGGVKRSRGGTEKGGWCGKHVWW